MFLPIFFIILLFKYSSLAHRYYDFHLTSQYNHKLSEFLFLLSADAYSSNPGICIPKLVPLFSYYFCHKSARIVCDKKRNKCGYYILVNMMTRKIIIVFSGTKGNLQLFREGMSMFKKLRNFNGTGLINNYLFETHQFLWKEIEDIFEHPLFLTFQVIVTGHSFGGALAALIALRIQLEGHRSSNDIFLYTFGEPRVGTRGFAINFDERILNSWRVVHSSDFVPHIPSCKKLKKTNKEFLSKRKSLPCDPYYLNGYYHHGTEIWYPNRKNFKHSYRVCLGSPPNEDFKCSDQIMFREYKYRQYRNDHSNYFNDICYKYSYVYYENYNNKCKIVN